MWVLFDYVAKKSWPQNCLAKFLRNSVKVLNTATLDIVLICSDFKIHTRNHISPGYQQTYYIQDFQRFYNGQVSK